MPTLNWPSRDKDLQQAGTQNTTRERIRLYGEVFTPPETVDTMYNIIPEDVYEKNMSFLDPACGEGAFLTKCLLNKLQKINTETGNREPQWESNAVAALSSIYGIEINEKNVIRCRMNLGNILKNQISNPETLRKIDSITSKNIIHGDFFLTQIPERMDVIIGNPPYQSSLENTSLTKPLYTRFIEKCISLSPRYCILLTPTRWFTGEGQDGSFPRFRKFMKENNHIRKFKFMDAGLVFPSVLIPGNVGYFLYDSEYSENSVEFDDGKRPLFEDGMDIIIDSAVKASVLKKVVTKTKGRYINEIMTGCDAFGFSGNRAFVKTCSRETPFHNSSKLITVDGTVYISKDAITKNRKIFESYKVFTSKADGAAGLTGMKNRDGTVRAVRITGKSFISHPFEACTYTYLPAGSFDNLTETTNLYRYMQTRFFRFMVGIMKASQNLYRGVYRFVPVQDFTGKSDIDWESPVEEIDRQLYEKYDLNDIEISYIEKTIAIKHF